MTNRNVAVGYQALKHSTFGSNNTALGYHALRKPEPFTEWYKAAVKAKGLTPHVKEQDGSQT
jgi:hypothetical protein